MTEKQLSESDKNSSREFLRDKSASDLGLDTSFAKNYLNNVTPEYYKKINMGTPESFITTKRKLEQLKPFLINLPRDVVSIGVGAGEEIKAAASVFERSRVQGLDLALEALHQTRNQLDKYGLKAELIEASGTQMPFAKDSIDVFIQSSILHEIYSYLPDGKRAWKKVIGDTAIMLAENGLLLLRDFSSPSSELTAVLEFKSDFEKNFYNYFRQYYRVFETWAEEGSSKILDKRGSIDLDYPQIEPKGNSVILPFDRAGEFLLHYRNFCKDFDRNSVDFRDPKWKEINETYLPPNPNKSGISVMTREEYVSTVLTTANDSLLETPYKLICVKDATSPRQETADFLMDNFILSLQNDDTKTQDELFKQVTDKMELIFQKVRK